MFRKKVLKIALPVTLQSLLQSSFSAIDQVMIGQLGEKEKEIILRRYYKNQTQTQVAQALDISQVQVSRLEKKILKQMRDQF